MVLGVFNFPRVVKLKPFVRHLSSLDFYAEPLCVETFASPSRSAHAQEILRSLLTWSFHRPERAHEARVDIQTSIALPMPTPRDRPAQV